MATGKLVALLLSTRWVVCNEQLAHDLGRGLVVWGCDMNQGEGGAKTYRKKVLGGRAAQRHRRKKSFGWYVYENDTVSSRPRFKSGSS